MGCVARRISGTQPRLHIDTAGRAAFEHDFQTGLFLKLGQNLFERGMRKLLHGQDHLILRAYDVGREDTLRPEMPTDAERRSGQCGPGSLQKSATRKTFLGCHVLTPAKLNRKRLSMDAVADEPLVRPPM